MLARESRPFSFSLSLRIPHRIPDGARALKLARLSGREDLPACTVSVRSRLSARARFFVQMFCAWCGVRESNFNAPCAPLRSTAAPAARATAPHSMPPRRLSSGPHCTDGHLRMCTRCTARKKEKERENTLYRTTVRGNTGTAARLKVKPFW